MPQRSTTRRRHGVATAATAVVALTAMLDGGSALAAGQVPAGPASGDFSQVHPHYVRLPMKDAGATSAKAAVATGTVRAAMVANPALPLFAHSFVSGGKTYSYAMVGTDPLGPAATSTIADTVTSVSFVVGTETISPSWAGYSSVLNSALFRPTALPGGTGQYGDVFLRNQFWGWLQTTKPAGMKNWHVKLAAPLTRPRITLRVPTGKGQVRTVHGVRLALVDATWFDTAVQAPVTAARADVFSQLLGGDVVLCHPYTTALTGCGIGVYHSVTRTSTGLHTYSFQAYLNSNVFGVASGFTDVGPMSHELAEWLADPYLNNVVPGWKSPLAPQYGCLNGLETGDPVVGSQITIGGLHYQDEAFLWWFARHNSLAWKGRYTWFNALTTLSAPCTPPVA